MDKFRKTLQHRLIIVLLYNAVILIAIALSIYFNFQISGADDHVLGFIDGFKVGLFAAAQIILIYSMIRYTKALKNDGKLKQLYIEENDERSKFIVAKIGGVGLDIILFGLVLSCIVASYINALVFFTLLLVLIFTVIVKASLKIYYNKRF